MYIKQHTKNSTILLFLSLFLTSLLTDISTTNYYFVTMTTLSLFLLLALSQPLFLPFFDLSPSLDWHLNNQLQLTTPPTPSFLSPPSLHFSLCLPHEACCCLSGRCCALKRTITPTQKIYWADAVLLFTNKMLAWVHRGHAQFVTHKHQSVRLLWMLLW